MQDFSESLPQFGPLAEPFGHNVSGAQQGVCGRGNLLVGVDEVGRSGVEVDRLGLGSQDFVGQRFQAPRSCSCGESLLLGLVGEIEILQPLGGAGGMDLLGEFFGQFALRFDGAKYGLLPLGKEPQFVETGLDLPDLLFV